MTNLIGSIFKVSIKYVYRRGDNFYYQRKIPLDLQSRFGGGTHIKQNLGTNDLGLVARKVTSLNKQYESTWEAMRNNASITPTQVREAATRLLRQYDLKPLPHINPEHAVDQFIENILEPKRMAHAAGDDEVYEHAPASNYLSEIETTALALLNERPKFMLSDALDFYLNMHEKAKDEDFREYNKRIWDRFVNLIGDKPFEKLTRADINLFVEKLLGESLKTGTVRRNLRCAAAIYNHGLLEKAMDKSSPFKSIKIGGEDTDTEKREHRSCR